MIRRTFNVYNKHERRDSWSMFVSIDYCLTPKLQISPTHFVHPLFKGMQNFETFTWRKTFVEIDWVI